MPGFSLSDVLFSAAPASPRSFIPDMIRGPVRSRLWSRGRLFTPQTGRGWMPGHARH